MNRRSIAPESITRYGFFALSKSLGCILSVCILLFSFCTSSPTNTYYLDSNSGSDANSGLSPDQAWKSTEKVSSNTFKPGDIIRVKRGSSYSGGLQLNGDGTAEAPITLTAYGKGPAPRFTNTDNSSFDGNAIQLNGDHQIVEHVYVYGTNAAESEDFLVVWKLGGIKANLGADHAIIHNNEIVDCPIGINSYSDSAQITANYIHDCNRVLNAPNWGPIGIRIGMGNTEIAWNRIENYHSMGGTWGGDGGAIEIDDGRNPRNNIYIHHNKTERCMGFLEMSYGYDICADEYKDEIDLACEQGDCRDCTEENRIFNNIVIAYNESRDYRTFTQIWAPLRNSFIENNTIIRTLETPDIESNVFCEFDPDRLADDSPTVYRNNLVVVVTEKTRMGTGNQIFLGYPMAQLEAYNNLFYNLSGHELNMTNEETRIAEFTNKALFADPLLIGLDSENYQLSVNSPAIDAGSEDAHYDTDLNGNPIIGKRDIGAYERKVRE